MNLKEIDIDMRTWVDSPQIRIIGELLWMRLEPPSSIQNHNCCNFRGASNMMEAYIGGWVKYGLCLVLFILIDFYCSSFCFCWYFVLHIPLWYKNRNKSAWVVPKKWTDKRAYGKWWDISATTAVFVNQNTVNVSELKSYCTLALTLKFCR